MNRILASLLAVALCLSVTGPATAQQAGSTDPLAGLLDNGTTPDPSLEDLRLSLQELDALLTDIRQQLDFSAVVVDLQRKVRQLEDEVAALKRRA